MRLVTNLVVAAFKPERLLGRRELTPSYPFSGGSAFTHGPTYARLISELILHGRASVSIDLYSPARFSHLNNFMASI